MNFEYSEDQAFLRDEARKFLASACPISSVRKILDSEDVSYDAQLWSSVAEMGWLGMNVAEAHGGLGLGYIELCATAEEIGRAIAPIPFSSTVYILAEALRLYGNDAQQAEILPKIVAGSAIGCLATSEGPGTIDVLTTVVNRGRLSGTKIPVIDGDVATHALVQARENGSPGLFIVALDADGVSRTPLRSLDPTRGLAALRFSDAPAERLGAAGDGRRMVEALQDRAAALLAFEQLGGADRCLEMARDFALERQAFGRVIGGYQAIKHKLADMFVKNQLARSHAYYAAWALGHGGSELVRAAAAARVAASEAYWHASKEMIETFGGIGATWEADCHLHYRRAKQLSLAVGPIARWQDRLAHTLETDPAI